MIDELKNQFKNFNNQITLLKAEMVEKSKPLILAAAKKAFEEAPEITSFKWTQFTPYFNDGDTCYFRVNDVEFTIEGLNSDDEGCYLYTEEHLEHEKNRLLDIQEYNKDPVDYFARKRREDTLRNSIYPLPPDSYYKPYFTEQAIQETIEEIEHQLTIISGERAKQISAIVDAFAAVIKEVPEDIMQTVFGDHVEITVTPTEVLIDEYAHD